MHVPAVARVKGFWDVTAPLDRSRGGGFPVTPCTCSPHGCLWWRSPRRAGLRCGSRETSAVLREAQPFGESSNSGLLSKGPTVQRFSWDTNHGTLGKPQECAV